MATMTVHTLLCKHLPPDLAGIVTDYVIRKDWKDGHNWVMFSFRHIEYYDNGEPTRVKELLHYVNMMEGPVWRYDDYVGFKIEKKKKKRAWCNIPLENLSRIVISYLNIGRA